MSIRSIGKHGGRIILSSGNTCQNNKHNCPPLTGSEVVELTLSDADGDTITLSIAAGDNISDRKFQLVDRAIQTTSSAIDYESLSGQDYGYTLSVTATDGASTATATVYISVS